MLIRYVIPKTRCLLPPHKLSQELDTLLAVRNTHILRYVEVFEDSWQLSPAESILSPEALRHVVRHKFRFWWVRSSVKIINSEVQQAVAMKSRTFSYTFLLRLQQEWFSPLDKGK